jgi:hypothetical protein
MKIENRRRKHYAFFLSKKGLKLAENIREKIGLDLRDKIII